MHETMGLSGTDSLWILGRPYNLGGCDTDHLYHKMLGVKDIRAGLAR